MTKKKINVHKLCKSSWYKVICLELKNSSYDDDSTMSKNNVCRIKQVDLSIIPSSENIQTGFYQI